MFVNAVVVTGAAIVVYLGDRSDNLGLSFHDFIYFASHWNVPKHL